jgi:excisionase family DNA binding protein
MKKVKDYLRVKEAAELLGVSPNTLRNWASDGKIRVHRNPVNGYRLFARPDLEDLLDEIHRSAKQRNDRQNKGQRALHKKPQPKA